MLLTRTKRALIALLTLSSHVRSVCSEPSATSGYASTTTGVMKSVGCYSSSGDMTDLGTYEWQSSSYCQRQCLLLNKPVLGLTNGGYCWCGDLLPAADTAVSSSECDINCYGYDEPCGGSSTWTVWLTGQQAVVGSVSDGSGSSSESSSTPQSTSASTKSSAAAPSSSSEAVLSSSPSSSPSPSPSPSSSSAFSSSATEPPTSTTSSLLVPSTTSTRSTTSAAKPTPSTVETTAVVTVTVGGSVRTIIGTTIIAAPSSSTPSATVLPSSELKSSNSSKIGIAVGVVVGILAIVALSAWLVFYFRRKSKRTFEARHGRQNSIEGVRTPRLPDLGPAPEYRPNPMYDSRLDPRIAVERRQSGGSMFDNVDYSRRILKVTNPDG